MRIVYWDPLGCAPRRFAFAVDLRARMQRLNLAQLLERVPSSGSIGENKARPRAGVTLGHFPQAFRAVTRKGHR